jgi:hypothetical protein
MADHRQESKQTTLTTTVRAGSISESSATASMSIVDSRQDDSLISSTSIGTATITGTAQPQDATTTPSSSQVLSNSSISSIGASTGSLPPKTSISGHQWHPTKVGTVVSETEIPEAWGPKFLDAERARQERFLGGMALIFVVTILGIVGIGWWR